MPVKRNLEELLRRLTFWKEESEREEEELQVEEDEGFMGLGRWIRAIRRADRWSHQKEAGTEKSNLEKGFMRWVQFWRRSESEILDTGRKLRGAGVGLKKGDLEEVKRKAGELDISWLKREAANLKKEALSAGRYLAEHFFPWDYDRKWFGVTLWHLWTDIETRELTGEKTLVKMVSTIKPFEREWKLTVRTKLTSLGKDGVILGKAGLYLVGDEAPYYGAELDKVWSAPQLPYSSIFVNANFRSSRKPDSNATIGSAGIQQTVPLRNGARFTFRVGYDTNGKFYFTPVPFGKYF